MSGTLDAVVRLADVLRRAGVDVSTGDVIDAGRALDVLDLGDRDQVRCGLRAVMVSREPDLEVFERAFDIVFAREPGRSERARSDSTEPRYGEDVGGDGGAGPLPRLAGELLDVVSAGDASAAADLAARAVALFDDPDRAHGNRHLVHRIMRGLDVANVLAAALRRARTDEDGGATSDLELMLRRHEIARALEAFRRALALEVARRGHVRPSDETDPSMSMVAADRPVLELSREELAELRRSLQPLIRQLAARVGRRRRTRSTGRLDVRRTVRRSLGSGGIPLEPVVRRRHPHRPDVVVLCDVSGSVAEFAPFTFMLVHALHEVLGRVRSFAFVGGIAETTDLFAHATHAVPVTGILERRGIVGLDGHSDYGAALRQFAAEHLDAVGPRTTVIVTGDARSNFRDPGVASFASIARRARRVYWLDPEPETNWDVDDSDLPHYRQHCDGVFHVATVRQLADVIADVI